jgi:hypothetical protein
MTDPESVGKLAAIAGIDTKLSLYDIRDLITRRAALEGNWV